MQQHMLHLAWQQLPTCSCVLLQYQRCRAFLENPESAEAPMKSDAYGSELEQNHRQVRTRSEHPTVYKLPCPTVLRQARFLIMSASCTGRISVGTCTLVSPQPAGPPSSALGAYTSSAQAEVPGFLQQVALLTDGGRTRSAREGGGAAAAARSGASAAAGGSCAAVQGVGTAEQGGRPAGEEGGAAAGALQSAGAPDGRGGAAVTSCTAAELCRTVAEGAGAAPAGGGGGLTQGGGAAAGGGNAVAGGSAGAKGGPGGATAAEAGGGGDAPEDFSHEAGQDSSVLTQQIREQTE